MEYDPKLHHRRSIRLPHYDYSFPGAYFVTLCAFGKQCLFGRVVDDQMRENACGRMVREHWLDTVRIRPQIELDAFIVMPNHLHGVLWILGPKGEHILWDSGYVIPDSTGPSSAGPDVGPKSLRPMLVPDSVGQGVGPSSAGPDVGPKSLRPNFEPNHVGPGPNAVRPYIPPGAGEPPRANRIPPMRPRSLASWASGFKSSVTSRIRKQWNDPAAVVWQEDYFERIIRDEEELLNIREYILSNPRRWNWDRENPEAEPADEDDLPWNDDDEPSS